ncbi:hypothetical protein DY000_02038923 [Brassica cretica]|uniref:Uncharacterized protein n=1 Tax=Brassica cretica TaxID=69181 RepID=A0ABQ7BF58_BRACR|nr:hypothetical protein DY000_02038923 [Brassica cretica]
MNPRKFPTNISSEYTEGLLPRNIPTDSFLGIFRGLRSSEIPDENSEEHFVGTSEDWTIGNSIEISRGSSPSVYSEDLSDELVVLGVSLEIYFLGIPSGISVGFPRKNVFLRSFFRGLVSSYSARFIADAVKNFLYSVNEGKIPKKRFNLRLASEETSIITDWV